MEKILIRIKHTLSIIFYLTGINFLINKFIKKMHGDIAPLTILCYHSINDLQGSMFERQMNYLLEHNYHFVSGKQLIELLTFPNRFDKHSKYICLTFDDCYEDNYTVVRQILLRKKIPAIFFAISSKLGQVADWDNNCIKQRIMTVEQLKEMSKSFDIGAHTQNHIKLGEAEPDVILSEIKNSKKELSDMLNKEIALFAYPNGSYNAEAIKYVNQFKFKAAFTIEQHTNYSYQDIYTLGRYVIYPDNFLDFKLKVMGGYDWYFFKSPFRRND